ncbi:hypothetical protein [Kitasatospora sp. NPDC058478]|uniref:hypothetical protein n=1 Tax=unclassified Kitasatospora TaxID=2633591 RepID=UPI003664F8C8
MTSAERLTAHYLAQAAACITAIEEVKRNPANRRHGRQVADIARVYSLAANAWRASARALYSDLPSAPDEHDSRRADAIRYQIRGDERRVALEGGELPEPPTEEPEVPYADDIDPADVIRSETHTFSDPAQPDLPVDSVSIGTTPDGRHVTVAEDTRVHGETHDPDGHPYTVMRNAEIVVHPSAGAAREEMLYTVAHARTNPVDWYSGPDAGLFLGWGERYRVGVTPHDSASWAAALLDDRTAEVSYHPSREEAVEAALAAADRLVAKLTTAGARGSRVSELGALWLGHRVAQARAAELKHQFAARLRQAKADRIVDRYGEIDNGQLARLADVSVQAINQML